MDRSGRTDISNAPAQTHIPNNIAISLRQFDQECRDRDSGLPVYEPKAGGYDFSLVDLVKTCNVLKGAGITYFDSPNKGSEETWGSVVRHKSRCGEMESSSCVEHARNSPVTCRTDLALGGGRATVHRSRCTLSTNAMTAIVGEFK